MPSLTVHRYTVDYSTRSIWPQSTGGSGALCDAVSSCRAFAADFLTCALAYFLTPLPDSFLTCVLASFLASSRASFLAYSPACLQIIIKIDSMILHELNLDQIRLI